VNTVETKISERLDRQIDALVEQGWFDSRGTVVQEAIRRFLEAHRPEPMERFIRQDVEWQLRGRTFAPENWAIPQTINGNIHGRCDR
jgi:hypothetical protein